MTLLLVLVGRALMDARTAELLGHQLNVTRRPRSRRDRAELEFAAALAPLLRAHLGDPVATARAVKGTRWAFAVDIALAQPLWLLERAEDNRTLLDRFNSGLAADWQLPFDDAPTAATAYVEPMRRAA